MSDLLTICTRTTTTTTGKTIPNSWRHHRCRIVATSLIAEYTLSTAAVARSFTGYLAQLIVGRSSGLHFNVGVMQLDLPSVALIAVLAILLMWGTR